MAGSEEVEGKEVEEKEKVKEEGEGEKVKYRSDSTKVEAANRRGQDQNEERGKAAEMHLGKWIGLEYRKEAHEKVQMHV